MIELELSISDALDEIQANIPLFLEWSSQHHNATDIQLRKFWYAPSKTYTYHTTSVVDRADSHLLHEVADIFLHANNLDVQPWYSAFLSGHSKKIDHTLPLPADINQAFTGQAKFDFGLKAPRYYNQVIADIRPNPESRIIGLRSITGQKRIENDVLAFTLSPTADVFQLIDNKLLWHHIVTVNGAALLPPKYDRLLMNTLRFLKLDFQEKNTYFEEAKSFQEFCQILKKQRE